MDEDNRKFSRRQLQTGYAWIVAGLLLLGGVLAAIVGIAYWWITGR